MRRPPHTHAHVRARARRRSVRAARLRVGVSVSKAWLAGPLIAAGVATWALVAVAPGPAAAPHRLGLRHAVPPLAPAALALVAAVAARAGTTLPLQVAPRACRARTGFVVALAAVGAAVVSASPGPWQAVVARNLAALLGVALIGHVALPAEAAWLPLATLVASASVPPAFRVTSDVGAGPWAVLLQPRADGVARAVALVAAVVGAAAYVLVERAPRTRAQHAPAPAA